MTTDTPRKRLGEILVDENIILPEQIDEALIRQRQTGRRLGQVLIDMGLITHDELAMVLSDQMGVPHVWLRKELVDPRIINILPREVCEMHTVMPMFKVRNILTIALVDSSDIFAIDDIERVSGCTLQPVQCRQSDIEEAIEEFYTDSSMGVDDLMDGLSESDIQVVKSEYEDLSMVEEMAEGAQVINLVNYIILNAIKDGVSDIHIEPDARISRVRCRLDGVLQEMMTPPSRPGRMHSISPPSAPNCLTLSIRKGVWLGRRKLRCQTTPPRLSGNTLTSATNDRARARGRGLPNG